MGRKSINKTRTGSPAKKEELIQRLIPFLLEKGLQGVTMDNMAEAMNISKATVYKYFQSREEILAATIAVKLDEIKHFDAYLNDKEVEYLDRYKNAVQYLSEHISDITNLFLADLKTFFPHLWQLIDAFKEYCMNSLKAYYNEGIRKGYFNKINPEIMVMTDQFFLDKLTDPDFLVAHKLTIKQAFDEYFRMKFYGIMK
jgi:AcrR family transcriptional regulator